MPSKFRSEKKTQGLKDKRLHLQNMVGHARRRARERFGLDLSPADYDWICTKVFNGGGITLRQTKASKEVQVEFSGRMMVAVYNRQYGRIVTFLEPPCPTPPA